MLAAIVLLFANFQEPEKRICWESIGIYEDQEYKKKLPDDDWIMKQYGAKGPKYVKRVKESTKKILADRGFELVECPDHRPECLDHSKDCKKPHQPDDGILKKVVDPDGPYHMRLLMTYSVPFNRVRVFVKIEVYHKGKKLFEFADEGSMSWRAAASYERRRERILGLGNRVAATMVDKIKEHQKKQ